MISPQPGMGVSPKISSVHTDFLPPYPLHHNILSLRLETDNGGFNHLKVFQLLMWRTQKVFLKVFLRSISHVEYAQPPFPPFNQLTVSIEAREGKATLQPPIYHLTSASGCHPVPGRSHIQNCQITGDVTHRCHMWWRSPTFSLGPSGPPGVLTSPADQAHRGGQGAAKQLNLAEEAFPTSGFPAALALPQPPAYVPAARLPPHPQQTL